MPEMWAVLEHRDGSLYENSGELLAELAEVAQRQPEQVKLCALILTSPDVSPLALRSVPDTASLDSLGVQNFYLVEHPLLADYTTEGYVDALAWFIQDRRPLLVAASATANGRDWSPRLAVRLGLPYVPGCLGLDLQDDSLLALRSVYEGRAYIHTRTTLNGRTALVTLVPEVRGMPAGTQETAPLVRGQGERIVRGQGERMAITHIRPELTQRFGQERIRRLAIKAPSPEVVELEAAERIVAGGRGIGREGFNNVATFARLLGAAVGATRVAADRGWIEHARQIGTTGKSVHPRLYIACGISGAAQHTAGMREAQTVVAINPDRNAPIFSLADLGLLGDANQVLSLAARLLEERSPRV